MLNIPKDIKLVIFDLDGTLYHFTRFFELSLDIKQRDILDFLHNHGIKLVLATKNAFAEFVLY